MIVNQLRRLAFDRGSSLRAVAIQADISYPAVQRFAAGKTKGIDFETLDKLCALFGVTPCELLEYRPEATE